MFLSLLHFGLPVSSHGAGEIASYDKFRKFVNIYEPSAVQQLPDGRFVVVEDEAVHSLDVFSLQPGGEIIEQPLYRSSLFSWSSPNRVLNTLEDLGRPSMIHAASISFFTGRARP